MQHLDGMPWPGDIIIGRGGHTSRSTADNENIFTLSGYTDFFRFWLRTVTTVCHFASTCQRNEGCLLHLLHASAHALTISQLIRCAVLSSNLLPRLLLYVV